MAIWLWIEGVLKSAPELAIFLAVSLGFWIGNRKIKSFNLGAVTGTLLVGLLIGQIGIVISPQIKAIFFIMFLFAVGFGVGPQFVRGIASDGLPQAVFAVVISLLCLACVYIAARVAGYGPGIAAGLLAGSQTISASIGLATGEINRGFANAAEAKAQLDAIPVSYAVTYLFGTIGTGWIISMLGPKILRIDLKKECARYEQEMNRGGGADLFGSAWRPYTIRAFKLKTEGLIAGKTVKQAETEVTGRLFLERLRRDGQIIEFTDQTILKIGDIIAVSGDSEALIAWSNHAEEVADPELMDIPVETVDVVVTKKEVNNRKLIDLSKEDYTRGIYINRIRRGSMGVDIPVQAQVALNRGDIVSITGTKKRVATVTKYVGYADRPTSATDMVLVGGGIVLGGLIGSIVIHAFGVPITLSTSGGALISGLFFGWVRSFTPKIGNVPSATVWFMNSVGLNIFIAVVGISAGPTFVAGLEQVGVSVFLWGVFATAVPMLLAPLIGKYIFRFDDAINLGCCGGARTSTASVAMVAEAAGSNVPMLGYTVPYAVSNTLLTLWGMVVVLLLHH